ncbi:uncharacterized protein C4orf50 homolog [Callospermophilus lateralis]|uniref:uncharacterized protein C4orf50 homolog n=1 Tax=Callospermophilus lateralis TaxID=76772 RepID=UPI00405488BC
MEPTAQGRTEKSFRYVIRAPSSDALDVTHVDVKIDTCWIFRDLEESGEAQGCLPEEVAGTPEVDTGMLRKQLESSEQKPVAAVDTHVMLESRLRSRIQALEVSQRKLLQEVDRLRACVVQERSTSLWAQEQLRALQEELVSQVRQEESVAWRQRQQLRRLRGQLRRRDEALGLQAAALEHCRRIQRCQLGLVRDQERILRAQVQRLERDVRHLCRAAGLLLAQRGNEAPAPVSPVSGKPRLLVPADPRKAPEAAAELRALQQRAELSEHEREEAVRRLREQRATERLLRGQLEELRCCIYGLQLSEIGLQGQVEELAQQNQSLREELGAQAPAGGSSLGGLGRAQDDSPCQPREGALGPCSQGRLDGAQGRQASAGQPLEGPHTCICAGAGPGPESAGELSEGRTGSAHEQPPLAEPSLDGQTLLLVCGSSPAQHMDGSLIALDLAWVSEGLRAAQAQEPFLQVQTSTLPLQGLAGTPGLLLPLLSQKAPPEELQEVLDTRSTPAPSAAAHPSWCCHQTRSPDASPRQGSPCTSDHPCPMEGSSCRKDTWNGGGGTPAGGAGHGEARTLGRIEGELGGQESCEDPSVGSGVCSPGGVGDESVTLETQATAYCPWLWQECPAPPLQGEDSTEEPEPLSRRQKVGGCGRGLLGGLSPEEEAHGTSASRPAGGQLPAGRSRALERRVPGKQDSRPGSGSALRSPEGSPGAGGQEEEEEKGLCREASSLGNGPVPRELDFRQCQGKETLPSVAGCGLPQSPRQAVPGEDTGPPRALSKGQDRYSLQIDALERDVEACFQQLNTLKLGSRGHQRETALLVGENWSFAQRRQSRGEGSGEATSLEQTVAQDTSRAVAGTSPDQEEASLDPAELHGNALSTPWHTLERARATFHQLLSSLKNERSQVLCDRAAPREDQEGCCPKACHLEAEGPRRAARVCRLQQANRALEGDLAQLRRELGQYTQAISDLEECNAQSYGKISELEEENDKLKRDLGRLRRAMSQSARESRGPGEHVTLENRELKALISQLGVSYKELVRGVGLGVEGMVRASQGENQRLLRRVRALEQEVALQTSGDRARSLGGRQQPQESTKAAVDKVCTVDRGVQVTPLSGQQVTSPCGPPLEEAVGVPGGQTGPAADLQDPRCGAGSTAPSLVWRNADVPRVLRGRCGAGGGAARLEGEEKRPWCSHQGHALRTSRSGPQDAEAETSKEDPRLCVRRLRHQVQTLQCQLRDQGWAHRELQEELKGKLEELQRKQHEANVAVAPLKAKLASLVHKCLRRNHLITRLLRELGRHGPVDLLLSEMAQNMVHDVALSEYAAAFLTPGVPETSHHLDVGSQGTAAARVQEQLPSSETDRVLQSPLRSDSWPFPKTEWPAPTARLDSPKPGSLLLAPSWGPGWEPQTRPTPQRRGRRQAHLLPSEVTSCLSWEELLGGRGVRFLEDSTCAWRLAEDVQREGSLREKPDRARECRGVWQQRPAIATPRARPLLLSRAPSPPRQSVTTSESLLRSLVKAFKRNRHLCAHVLPVSRSNSEAPAGRSEGRGDPSSAPPSPFILEPGAREGQRGPCWASGVQSGRFCLRDTPPASDAG